MRLGEVSSPTEVRAHQQGRGSAQADSAHADSYAAKPLRGSNKPRGGKGLLPLSRFLTDRLQATLLAIERMRCTCIRLAGHMSCIAYVDAARATATATLNAQGLTVGRFSPNTKSSPFI